MAPSVFNKVAHSAFTPKIVSNAIDDSPLQAWITAEKGVLTATKLLATDTQKSADCMEAWAKGQLETSTPHNQGNDLNDVCGKLGRLTGTVSTALTEFLKHGEDFRTNLKHVRTREERLADLKKKRDGVYRTADTTDKRVQKLQDKPEHKDLESTRAKLQGLRQEAQNLDRMIVNEEAQLAAFKRQTVRHAGSVKLAAYLQVAQKITIVAELGKLMLQELDPTVVPPGQPRPAYEGFENVENLYAEAKRCLSEVRFDPSLGPSPGKSPGGAEQDEDSQQHPTFGDPNVEGYDDERQEYSRTGYGEWADGGGAEGADNYYPHTRSDGSHDMPSQVQGPSSASATHDDDLVGQQQRRVPNISKEELVTPTEDERMGDLHNRESTYAQPQSGQSTQYHSFAPGSPPQNIQQRFGTPSPYLGVGGGSGAYPQGSPNSSASHQGRDRLGATSALAGRVQAGGGGGQKLGHDSYSDQYRDYNYEGAAGTDAPPPERSSYEKQQDPYANTSSVDGMHGGPAEYPPKKRLPQPPPLPSHRPPVPSAPLSLANPDDYEDEQDYGRYGPPAGGGYPLGSGGQSTSSSIRPINGGAAATGYGQPTPPPPNNASANAANAILQGGYSSGHFATDLTGSDQSRKGRR